VLQISIDCDKVENNKKKKVNKTTTKPKLNANNDRQTTRKTAAKPKKTTTTSRETKSNALTPIDTPGDKSF